MKDIREVFEKFLADQELVPVLNHSGVATNVTVPELRYSRIDRYDFSVITKDQLFLILEFISQFHEYIDVYFAFGKLCIGYHDHTNGIQKRIGAFDKPEIEVV